MNIYDISRAAGVSIASVSRVINGAQNVSEKTRQKVTEVIEELGYTPNVYARGLGRGSMQTIGIMCSDSADIYFAHAISYLETALRKNGYNSILCCTGYELRNKMSSFELLRSRQVDAIILAGSRYVELRAEDNQYILDGAREIPVMLINGILEGENIYCTLSDDASGMKQAVRKLRESGCRDFIYVYSSDSYSGRAKLRGLRMGCASSGVAEDALRIVRGKKDFQSIAALLEEEYEKRPFDAVIASSDTTGVGAVKFANRRGLSLPDELSILSFNNSVLAECSSPELSSVDPRLKDVCEKTVRRLLQLLSSDAQGADGRRDPERLPAKKLLLRPKIAERQTTRFLS